MANSAVVPTILQDKKKYFLELKFLERKVSIILDLAGLIESFGRAIILLANRTTLCIPNALYSSKI